MKSQPKSLRALTLFSSSIKPGGIRPHLVDQLINLPVRFHDHLRDIAPVLVLQGGGALGAYQVGVYEALHEAGVEPDWIVGTSIGAINASIIAGNKPQDRLTKLDEFWRRMERPSAWPLVPAWTGLSDA